MRTNYAVYIRIHKVYLQPVQLPQQPFSVLFSLLLTVLEFPLESTTRVAKREKILLSHVLIMDDANQIQRERYMYSVGKVRGDMP